MGVPTAPAHSMAGLSALLLLTDGRYPSGGYAHSGGLEAAEAMSGVHDLVSLDAFLRGRLATVGLVSATFAAAANRLCAGLAGIEAIPSLVELEHELDARTPSSIQRRTSRKLGRQLLRAARGTWPDPLLDALDSPGLHQPLVLGVVTHVAGLDPYAAALASAHEAVVGPASAAVRLLALDPVRTHRLIATFGQDIDQVARDASYQVSENPSELSAQTAPMLDIGAEDHATWEVRLFAS